MGGEKSLLLFAQARIYVNFCGFLHASSRAASAGEKPLGHDADGIHGRASSIQSRLASGDVDSQEVFDGGRVRGESFCVQMLRGTASSSGGGSAFCAASFLIAPRCHLCGRRQSMLRRGRGHGLGAGHHYSPPTTECNVLGPILVLLHLFTCFSRPRTSSTCRCTPL